MTQYKKYFPDTLCLNSETTIQTWIKSYTINYKSILFLTCFYILLPEKFVFGKGLYTENPAFKLRDRTLKTITKIYMLQNIL